MNQNLLILIVLLILNIPLFLFAGRLVYGSWDGFWDQFKWHFVPDFWSLVTGRFLRDMFGESKSSLFLFGCTSVYIFQIIIITNFL